VDAAAVVAVIGDPARIDPGALVDIGEEHLHDLLCACRFQTLFPDVDRQIELPDHAFRNVAIGVHFGSPSSSSPTRGFGRAAFARSTATGPRMAEFPGFSWPIGEQRKRYPEAPWRRERSATRNILHFRAHPRGNVARVEI
jgi:hypothetical protein